MAEPSTPILDAFNRADENPITGWTTWGANAMRVSSNRMSGGTAAAWNGAYLPQTFSGGNVEVWAQIDCGLFPDEVYYLSSTNLLECYRLLFNFPGSNQLQVQRRIAGSGVAMGTAAAWTFATGDSFWVNVRNGVHEVYAKTSAGSWTLLDSFTDTSHTSGVFGYMSYGTGQFVDNFGGGYTPPPTLFPTIPQGLGADR